LGDDGAAVSTDAGSRDPFSAPASLRDDAPAAMLFAERFVRDRPSVDALKPAEFRYSDTENVPASALSNKFVISQGDRITLCYCEALLVEKILQKGKNNVTADGSIRDCAFSSGSGKRR
jgi:hypothetical protein